MFKIIHKTKDGNSISIQDTETGETRAFSKIIVDDEGKVIGENPNFKAEVEEFVGKGFLNG